tara:strand:+ start:97 stop:438 length:342 start_codon:yes stop_codon:yes gene_type:complete
MTATPDHLTQEEANLDVLVTEKKITETWKGISVVKPLGVSDVHVKNEEGKWVQYGYIGHQSMMLSGLCGAPNELGEAIAEACSKKLKTKVTFVGAPLMEEEASEEPETEESDE